jgi:hypothetical protein
VHSGRLFSIAVAEIKESTIIYSLREMGEMGGIDSSLSQFFYHHEEKKHEASLLSNKKISESSQLQ